MTLIKRVMDGLRLDLKKYNPNAILSRLSSLKNELISVEHNAEAATGFFDRIVQQVYVEYQKKLKENHAVDFDDLLMLTVQIFQENPNVLQKYRNWFRYILVDEFQDTNKANYVFTHLLTKESQNILVVGDDAQGIFSWRGANIRNILDFQKDYLNTRTIMLDQNYRSTPQIVQAASAVISNNAEQMQKELWTENTKGERIGIHELPNERREGDFIIQTLKHLTKKGTSIGECAVLYRTHAQSRAIEESLLRHGMPYQIVSGTSFYERKEIKDVLAYLRLLANPYDTLSFQRIYNVPTRGIGAATFKKMMEKYDGKTPIPRYLLGVLKLLGKGPFEKVKQFAGLIASFQDMTQTHTLSQLAKHIIGAIDYEKYLDTNTIEGETRWENVKELFTVIKKYDDHKADKSLELFLEEVSLIQDTDKVKEGEQSLKLLTFHAAKGLEFNTVFMVGMEEGVFPHSRALISPLELEEERRLCYVGITRAEKNLFMTHCRKRALYGTTQYNLPSRFLFEIPEHLKSHSLLEDADMMDQYEEDVVQY